TSLLVLEGRAPATQKCQWAEGRALSYTAGMSYWLARAILADLLEIESDAAPEKSAAQLKKVLNQQSKSADLYVYLARLFELPLDKSMQERVKFLSTQALQARILHAVQDYVRLGAILRPLVLIWEDLHWADLSSSAVSVNLLP